MSTATRRPLAGIEGGRVLDVATGSGQFIGTLVDDLASFDEMIGIDSNDQGAASFGAAFADPRISFRRADALAMPYTDASFDTVAISASLHHFDDAHAVLTEMLRVLRPGGHIVVAEMYRDRQRAPQRTHVALHHWAAELDRLAGETHRPTESRADLVRLVGGLGLSDVRFADVAPDDEDPFDPATLAAIEVVLERRLEQARGQPVLRARGRRIQRRLREVGMQSATMLLAVGRKPPTGASG